MAKPSRSPRSRAGRGIAGPIDLGAFGFRGLRFAARNATGTADLHVRVTDEYSEPDGELCLARSDLYNTCLYPEVTQCAPEGCFDSASQVVQITDEWQTFDVYFSDLAREGWGAYVDGAAAPDTLDESRAYQLQFALLEESFDLWLDNVGFIR